MNRIVLATRNRGKVDEISPRLDSSGIAVSSLLDIPFETEIEENATTFEGNALIKAETVCQATGLPALADDSGLEVDALSGRPGVHSARFGGVKLTDRDRNLKLLTLLDGVPIEKRTARFRAVLVIVFPHGANRVFDGTLSGTIAFSPAGNAGFGYDPIFIPEGYDHTLAELGPAIKNRISHRARALDAFFKWLKSENC